MANHRITALKAQQKNPDRVSIYLDGEFAFGVGRIVAAWLHVGQELTEEKIASLQQKEDQEAALQRALHLLSYRPHSEAEIRVKLKKAGMDGKAIDLAIERLHANGLVHDAGFAQDWVENRSAFRPRSRKMLAFELHQKGVAEEVIQEALENAQEDDDLAYQAASRYAHKLADTEWEEFRRRLIAFLARRGFSYGTALTVVQRIWQELRAKTG